MDIIKALGELAEAPGPEQVRTARLLGLPGEPARAEFTDLFVVQLYPYASVYLNPSGQLGGDVQDHIAGFWRAVQQPVPRDPDHIATLFSTYAQLAERARTDSEAFVRDLAAQMRHAFLWEHIASWLAPFVARVRELGSPTYRAWATLVIDAFEAEAVQAGPPSLLPLHLRKAPPLPVRPALNDLVDVCFSPVRSGIILTRADLARCARDLGVPMRIAERRYTLATLLGQDAARVQAWLAGEASRQADTMNTAPAPFGTIASHWQTRAHATAELMAHVVVKNDVRGMQG